MILFNNLKDEDLKLLNNVNIKTKTFHKNDIIFHEGEKCEYICYINEGKIIAKQSYIDGHDNIIRILNKNEYIGLNLIYSSKPEYKASFFCQNDTTISLISLDDMIYLMQNSTTILKETLKKISDYSITLNEHIKLLNHKTIKSKLCYYLFNEYKKINSLEFEINLSKTDLAAILNVERPSLSYELKLLINENIIYNNKKYYKIINLNKLLKYI